MPYGIWDQPKTLTLRLVPYGGLSYTNSQPSSDGKMLPAVKMSQFAVETAFKEADRIRMHVRKQSAVLTTHCRQAGLPMELAELCGGLLATVVEDLTQAAIRSPKDFERAKRLERVLAATDEPMIYALRIAVAASPLNGRAALRHWDAVCDPGEAGKLAWLVGVDTDAGWRYAKRMEQRQAKP